MPARDTLTNAKIEALFLQKLEEWKSRTASQLPKKTGEWRNSLAYRIAQIPSGWRIVLTQARHGFILNNMAKSFKRQANGNRKGGNYKGESRYQGAGDLPQDSPIRKNAELYQVFEKEKALLRERLSEIAIREMLTAMGDAVAEIRID